MTEKNIEQLISTICLLGLLLYFYGLSRSDSRSAIQNTMTEKHTTIWDKIKILSTIIAAIAALIFAIVKLYELIKLG